MVKKYLAVIGIVIAIAGFVIYFNSGNDVRAVETMAGAEGQPFIEEPENMENEDTVPEEKSIKPENRSQPQEDENIKLKEDIGTDQADITESSSFETEKEAGKNDVYRFGDERSNGSEEEAEEADVEESDITALDQIMYAQGAVNIRSGPSTDYARVGGLSTNQEVKVTGQSKSTGWYEIEVNGERQYVSNKYLGESKVPVAQQAPATTSNEATAPSAQSAPADTTPSNPDILPGGNAVWEGSDGLNAEDFDWSTPSPEFTHCVEAEGVHAY